MDYRDIDDSDIAEAKFVDLPNDFQCPICLGVLLQPQLVNCCTQCYCKSCLRRWRRIKDWCPLCLSKDFLFMDMPRVSAQIRALPVCCPNAPHGCNDTMALRDCPQHLSPDNPNGCLFAQFPCPNRCGEMEIYRSQLETHRKEICPKRLISCQHCGMNGPYAFITQQHFTECELFPIQCPQQCGVTTIRKDILAHQGVCPLQPLPCIFKDMGCHNTICRKDMDDHLQSAVAAHLTQLLASHSSLLKEHSTLRNDHSLLEEKYWKLSKEHNSLQVKNEELRQAHQSTENKMHSVGRVVESMSPQNPAISLALQQLNTMLLDTSKQEIGGSLSLVLSSCAERGSHKFWVNMIQFQLDWSYVLQKLFIRLYWMPPKLPHISQHWSCDFIMKLQPISKDAGKSPTSGITMTQILAVICCGKPQLPVKSTATNQMTLIGPPKTINTNSDVILILSLQHHAKQLSYLPPATHGNGARPGNKPNNSETFSAPFTMAQVFTCPCHCHKKVDEEVSIPAKHLTERKLSISANKLIPLARSGTQ